MNYPPSILNLIKCFKKLPGIGEKSAERLALSILNMEDEVLDLFSESLKNIKTKIKRCQLCHNLTEDETCYICNDKTRDKSVICVVEDPKNIIIFEKMGSFNGIYHVLDGLISPLDGINPEDINIDTLLKRIENNEISEIIIAVKPSIEGETTALYISKMLSDTDVIVTKIAHGIPLGAEIDYIDSLTLAKSIQDRKEVV